MEGEAAEERGPKFESCRAKKERGINIRSVAQIIFCQPLNLHYLL